MKQFTNPTVRGESVTIIRVDDEPRDGVLGATSGGNILVEYPDGEQGYVSESDIREAA